MIRLAGEKQKLSGLLAPPKGSDKMYKLDEHVVSVVAGLTADANILINNARVTAQRYLYTYQEPMPVGGGDSGLDRRGQERRGAGEHVVWKRVGRGAGVRGAFVGALR